MSEDALYSVGLQRDLPSGWRAADLLTFACSSPFCVGTRRGEDCAWHRSSCTGVCTYLAHKKSPPPRTLQ